MTTPTPNDTLRLATGHSRWLANRLQARPELGEWLCTAIHEPLGRDWMQDHLAGRAGTDEDSLKRALRDLRQRTMALLIVRDLAGLADLGEVTRTCTDLAEVTVRTALDWHHRDLADIHGEPQDAQGRPQRLIVVGMGKLGGRELNVSSDIDLIFVYPRAGETAGPRRLDNHEFFTRLGKRLIAALNDATGDGFVFRVDMRLRPYGDSGPLVSSFAMLEEYFYAQAREWERYAWIKARAIAGERIDELEALRKPFVFRKYLDFGAFAAMRDLHAQIRREVARKEMLDNIKLGPGGIREVEFIAQVFQLIRGGREPKLQHRPTRDILRRLAELGLLPQATAVQLDEAYVFLRNLEHRLQYLDDAQTQRLPHGLEDRRLIAAAMNFTDWEGFEAHLNTLRKRVSNQFEQVFGAPQEDQSSHPLANLCELPDAAALERMAELGYRQPESSLALLHGLRRSGRYAGLPAANKAALDGLLPPLVEVAARQPNPDDTLARILTLLEAIARRAPYLQLLREYPQTLTQVARMVSASPWAAQYLTRQPFLLDELLDARSLYAPPDWEEARSFLKERLANYAGDVERQMDELRHFKQSESFRLLAQDLTGQLSIEHLSDHLSALADLVLQANLDLIWASLPGRHRDTPAFAVIAYGKLGGKELGYASDLDMVFLYDDDHPDAQEIYARLAKRLNTSMSTLTAAGVLYETDLRLRPDGASGLLVSTVEAFDDYQRHHAWTWEHQALTRARYCCGDPAVGARFEAIRDAVLRQPRKSAELRDKVLEMRRKMRDGHPNPSGDFDVKHDPGGLVDVEFTVQYLVLAHAAAHPALTANIGNIALLKRCAELGLLPEEVALPAADAYRELRRLQHAAKLQNGEFGRAPHAQAAASAAAVRRLWETVFGA
ncbi:MAG TPA: bifunctional [glutamate--ammonia ligase]-adenylyl-L-tyrosine phosphorylase/[glutamate--ammonia-ligase] adenylyltransferase [Thiobacillaceae bacterium]|nr:bifunctional [glutamate--ammonia ligase]-adenylyl-L-tyrosine phosphorylase/[glutamate--ammonia-ligase] adenylyltransferase [Thiobacillaceae bacterium]